MDQKGKRVIEIRKAKTEDLREVLIVLNETTLNLHQKGINQWDYPWMEKEIKKEIENGSTYVLTNDERVIGTFQIREIDSLSNFPLHSSSMYLARIAILPEYQGKKLGSKITSFTCTFAGRLKKSLYLDCWAGNKKLKEFYTENGFIYLGDFPEEDYMVSIFKYNLLTL